MSTLDIQLKINYTAIVIEKGEDEMARRFGIEIEHANARGHAEIAHAVSEAGLVVDATATGSYQSHGYRGWQVKHDSSIRATRTHPHAVELVSPPLRFSSAGQEEVKKALDVIRSTGTVNRSCGFHVHVEARDLNDAQLVRLEQFFMSWKKVLMSYVPRSRRHNRFCQPTTSRHNRYVALNLVPFSMRGTVEFRLHHATLNAQKILSFIALCVNIVEFAKGEKDIPQIEIEPSTSSNERIVKVYKGQEFVVSKNAQGCWDWDGRSYPTLSAVATAIGNLFGRKRCSGPSFFGFPMTGNAMDALCREVAIRGQTANFLSRNYDRAVSQWGYFEERGSF